MEDKETKIILYCAKNLADKIRHYSTSGILQAKLFSLSLLFALVEGFKPPSVEVSVSSSLEQGHYSLVLDGEKVDGGFIPEGRKISLGTSEDLGNYQGDERYDGVTGLCYKSWDESHDISRVSFLETMDVAFFHLFQMMRARASDLFDAEAYKSWKDQAGFYRKVLSSGKIDDEYLYGVLKRLLHMRFPIFDGEALLEASGTGGDPADAAERARRALLPHFFRNAALEKVVLIRTGTRHASRVSEIMAGGLAQALKERKKLEEVLRPLGEVIFPFIEEGMMPLLVSMSSARADYEAMVRSIFPEVIVLAAEEAGALKLKPQHSISLERGRRPSDLEAFRWFKSRFDVFARKKLEYRLSYRVAPVRSDDFWRYPLCGLFAAAGGLEKEALLHYEKAQEIYGDHPVICWLLSDLYLRQGRKKEARGEIRRLKRHHGWYLDAAVMRARELLKGGAVREATESLTVILSCSRNHPETLTARGELYLQEGKLRQAIESLQRALFHGPHMLKALRILAWIHMDKGEIEDAEVLFRRILDIDESEPRSHYGLGLAFFYRKQWNESAWEFHRALQADQNLEGAWHKLGWLDLMVGNREQAEEKFKRAAELAPRRLELHMSLGVLYREMGAHQKAVQAFETARTLAPYEAGVLKELARSLTAVKRGEEALCIYDEALSFAPHDTELYYERGLIRFEQGDREHSIDDFRNALRRDPSCVSCREALGWAYSDCGNYAAAEQVFRKGLVVKPDDEAFLYGLASVLEARGFLDEAEKIAVQILAANPDSIRGSFLMGLLLERRHDLPGARQCYEKALSGEPHSVRYVQAFLSLLYRMGAYRKILEVAQESLSSHPDSGILYLLMGRAYRALKLDREAEVTWKEGLLRAPSEARLYSELFLLYLSRGSIRKLSALKTLIERHIAGSFTGRMLLVLLALAEADVDRALCSLRALAHDYPSRKGLSSYLSLLCFLTKNFDEAWRYYRQAERERGDAVLKDSFVGELCAIKGKSRLFEMRCLASLASTGGDLLIKKSLGEFYLRGHHIQQGERLLKEVLEKDRSLYRIHISYADACFRLGNLAGAASVLEEGRRLFPESPDMYAHSGFLTCEMGKNEEGERLINRALTLSSGNVRDFYALSLLWHRGLWDEVLAKYDLLSEYSRRSREALIMKATALMQTMRYDEALAVLQDARQHCVDCYLSGELDYLRALLHYEKGDFDGAREALNSARSCRTGAGNASLAEGLLQMMDGRYGEARLLLRRALKLRHPFPEARFLLGFCEEQEGSANTARSYYKGALRYAPHDRRYADALRRITAMIAGGGKGKV